jgi:hypothetical protein
VAPRPRPCASDEDCTVIAGVCGQQVGVHRTDAAARARLYAELARVAVCAVAGGRIEARAACVDAVCRAIELERPARPDRPSRTKR